MASAGRLTLLLRLPRDRADARLEAHLTALRAEFPPVAISVRSAGAVETDAAVRVDASEWNERTLPFDPYDREVDRRGEEGQLDLVIVGEGREVVSAGFEALTRWQRLIRRRNQHSSTATFDALLHRLRSLHDLERPLVRADYNHVLDTWQWTLRLSHGASAPVQMAALLHDIERLESEANARTEHLAADYGQFKAAHARRGAQIADACLVACGVDRATRERACALVASHERPEDGEDGALLADADALSFFSQNSAGYIDYFGPHQTARKIAYTLSRMRPEAKARLCTIRIRADVAAILDRAASAEPRSSAAAGEAP